jgi:uncharacterized protein YgiM (DUF1202 family)
MKTKIILTVLLLSATWSFGQVAYVKSKNGLNLRSGAGTAYPVIASIPQNGQVEIIETDGDWSKIKYNDQTGYVNSQYLSDKKSNTASNISRRKGSSQQKDRQNSSSYIQSSDSWGIGIRLGDPSGLTVKRFLGNKALEFSIGRTYVFTDRDYYDKHFEDWYYDLNYNYAEFQYYGYEASSPIGMQFHYLIRKSFGQGTSEGLEWYFGFGGQIRFQNYRYDYRYKPAGSNEWFYATGDDVTDFDFGADGVIGLEYRFNNSPISMFLDATLFMEIVDDPFIFWLQGGIGVRYNF